MKIHKAVVAKLTDLITLGQEHYPDALRPDFLITPSSFCMALSRNWNPTYEFFERASYRGLFLPAMKYAVQAVNNSRGNLTTWGLMKALQVSLVAALALTATSCSLPAPSTQQTTVSASPSGSTTVSPTPTPKPTPTPTAMTAKAAGAFYLATICKSNAASAAQTAAVQAEPFDLAQAQARTRAYRDALRQTILEFTKRTTLWPAAVQPDIDSFVEGLYGEMSQAEIVAQSTNPTGFFDAWNAWTDPTAASPVHVASQKIRLKLGLAADAKASCKL